MSKTALILLVVVVAAAGGGGAYYIRHQVETPTQPSAATAAPTEARGAPAEDLTKKKIDGIGDTRNLRPVPIPHGPAQ